MRLSNLVGNEITDYSDQIDGDDQNFRHAIRVDVTGGYVGITQYADDGVKVKDRVLLTPQQWRAIHAFLKTAQQHRRSAR